MIKLSEKDSCELEVFLCLHLCSLTANPGRTRPSGLLWLVAELLQLRLSRFVVLVPEAADTPGLSLPFSTGPGYARF